jgi:hypothetical protein
MQLQSSSKLFNPLTLVTQQESTLEIISSTQLPSSSREQLPSTTNINQSQSPQNANANTKPSSSSPQPSTPSSSPPHRHTIFITTAPSAAQPHFHVFPSSSTPRTTNPPTQVNFSLFLFTGEFFVSICLSFCIFIFVSFSFGVLV